MNKSLKGILIGVAIIILIVVLCVGGYQLRDKIENDKLEKQAAQAQNEYNYYQYQYDKAVDNYNDVSNLYDELY